MDKDNKENKDVIKLKEPIKFEGVEYKEIDLSGLRNMKTRTLIEAERIYYSGGHVAPSNEVSIEYALIIASVACNKPLGFFDELPPDIGTTIKVMVQNFFVQKD